jgi:hypothetical protein
MEDCPGRRLRDLSFHYGRLVRQKCVAFAPRRVVLRFLNLLPCAREEIEMAGIGRVNPNNGWLAPTGVNTGRGTARRFQ